MSAARKRSPREQSSRLPRAIRTSPAPWVNGRSQRRWQWHRPAEASCPSAVWPSQCWASSAFGDSFRSSSSSSKMGSDTTYFSEAQLPRSRNWQRSLQKGNSGLHEESVGVLHIGHLCCMAAILLPQDAQRRPGGNSSERFGGRWRRSSRDAAFIRPRKNLDHAANQIVHIGLADFDACNVPWAGDLPAAQLDIRKVQLAIDVRRHAF